MKVEQVTTSIVSHTSVGPSICGNPLALRRVIGHVHTLTCVPLTNWLGRGVWLRFVSRTLQSVSCAGSGGAMAITRGYSELSRRLVS